MTTNAEALLDLTLPFAVSINIMRLQRMSEQERAETIAGWTTEAADVLAHHGDHLLRRDSHTAEVFNRLAEALAALAFQPGGVTFHGQHWEAS